ncbi:hypothetical protein [Geothrix sp. PMB-07]|uniref:hypothetical protein n=1 Tax=Geothrix sp. PMB-07 TaxID=3068640 RepID=UPI0027426E5A|nr:hypothetical protein [Geothrix sp. PMB-07]WLT33120.1 hypothetical protein Q9293_07265 [Geothrix sp. PMB-07]
MSEAFDVKREHRITRDEAATLVQAHQSAAKAALKAGAQAPLHHASAFNRSAFEHLLAQPGAAGIRIYHAKHKDGSPTMVMVAVDNAGKDLDSAQSVFIQNGHECPPFCGGSILVS